MTGDVFLDKSEDKHHLAFRLYTDKQAVTLRIVSWDKIIKMWFSATLELLVFGLTVASGFDSMENENYRNGSSCSNLTVKIDTRAELRDMVFKRKLEYIEVSVYIEDELFDTFLGNKTVNPTFAMPPYHKFIWVNKAGMNIHQMDYRFKMWSLGTLSPSVKAIDFYIDLSDRECFRKQDVTKMFKQIQNTFMDTLLQDAPAPVLDYSYLCHRYELYSNSVKCLASKCFMFNEHHFNETSGFCSDNVNNSINTQVWIWIFLFLILLNNLPSLVFWLQGEPKKDTDKSKKGDHTYHKYMRKLNFFQHHIVDIDHEAEQNGNEEKRVRLFCISQSNCEYYPWMGRLFYHMFEDERLGGVIFRVVCFFVLFLLFYVWWYLIADLGLSYKLEFTQRSKMSNGVDDHLTFFELLLAGIWNPLNNFFLFSFIYSTLFNIGLAVLLAWPSVWSHRGRFFWFSVKFKDPNLKFNCLHRKLLLLSKTFWKEFCNSLIPSVKQRPLQVLVIILLAIFILPITLMAIIVLLFPLFDIILHLPFSLFKCKKNTEGNKPCTAVTIGNLVIEKYNIWKEYQFGTACLIIFLELIALMYCITFSFAYVYPTAIIYSMIVSYTITGIFKNWGVLLPYLVLVGIAVAHFIKLVYRAFQPLHDMEVIIFQKHQNKLAEFKELKAKFKQLDDLNVQDDQTKRKHVRFPMLNELMIIFPKLKPYIKQKYENHYIRLPEENELIAMFPQLNELLKFKDGSTYLSVKELIELVVSIFEKQILIKGDNCYIKCPELKNYTPLKDIERQNYIIQEDECYYVNIMIDLIEKKLNFENTEENCDFARYPNIVNMHKKMEGLITKTADEQYYIRVNIPKSKENELMKCGIFHKYAGCTECSQSLNESWKSIDPENPGCTKYPHWLKCCCNCSSPSEEKGTFQEIETPLIKEILKEIDPHEEIERRDSHEEIRTCKEIEIPFKTNIWQTVILKEIESGVGIEILEEIVILEETERRGISLKPCPCYTKCPQFLFDYWNDFPATDLIKKENDGSYSILDSFLEQKCYPFLDHGQFRFYTFHAFAELVVLILFLVVVWICLDMLNDNRSFGQVVVAILLTYIPHILDVITQPWHDDVSQVKLDAYIDDMVKEELNKRQDALTLRYILLALQFYSKDIKIPSNA